MRLTSTRRRLLASTMICGAAFAALAAAPAAAQDDTVQEVLVTGSRIMQPNLVTTSPVTQVTADDITTQGVTRVEDLMNSLPQAFAAQNSNISNGSTGTASVDLRGQGASRTMVLIDGKRMPYGSPGYVAADLNQIPGPLVERVEVLTGGASAVYGSDALAGVVNFIMKRNFQGLQLDAQYGFYQHNNDYDGPGNLRAVIAARAASSPDQFALPADDVNDGFSKEVTLIFGANTPDGRGNVTAYASWRHNDEVMQRDRDYSACTIDANAVPTTAFLCGGSSTGAVARFWNPGVFSLIPDAANPGQFRNFTAADQYNYGPLNYYQRPDERYSVGAFATYEIRDGMDAYADIMFTDSHTVAQIAPSGYFLGDTLDSINCGNPLMTVDMATDLGCDAAMIANDDPTPVYIGRRNVEGGPRQDDLTHQSYRVVAGLRGDLFDGWTYDVSAQYSSVLMSEIYRNEFSKTRGMRAIDVVDADPGPGVDPQCRSFVNGTDTNCVPYDLFSIGGVTPEALDYVSLNLFASGRTEQQIVVATVGGDLGEFGLKSSMADRPFEAVFGVEYRRESLISESDDAYESGDGWGQGGPSIGLGGAFDVYDAFVELQAPIAEGRQFADLLSFDLAYRKSHYSTDKDTNSYKVGAEWAPTSDIRFRGSYQRAVRAANVIELYRAQSPALFDGEDPCGSIALLPGAIASAAECAATGVPAALYGTGALDSPAGQYNQFAGGNPDLDPEESDTWTLGAVFTPSFIDGLVVSVDWFDIYIDQTIGTFGASNTLDACYGLNLASACSRIHRTPGGLLWVSGGFVENLNINTGNQATSGFDINASYTTSLERFGFPQLGDLSFNFVGTLLEEFSYNPGAGDDIQCVGLMDNACGTPNPEWRHRLRASWRMPWDIETSLTWRHYGEVSMEGVTTDRIDRDFPSYDWFDLAGSWRVRDNLTLKGGVNNIFDKDPPLSGALSGGNGNTYPQVYDSMGRFVFMRATVDF